jgi:hypothetical protein
MKSRVCICVEVSLLALLGAVGIHAQAQQAPSQSAPAVTVPRLIKFAGTLKDAQGEPRSNVVGVTFAIYKEQEGGAALWMETQNVNLDGNGAYTALLGANSANGVPAELFASGEARWLGAQVQLPGEVEQARVLLVSVPYALKAVDAETLGGKPASAFVTSESVASSGGSGSSTATTTSSTSTAPSAPTATTPKAAATRAQAACTSVTSDGAAAVNSIALFTAACNIEGSVMTQALINGFPGVNVAGNNAGLALNGAGTHQITVTGATSGRLGQDAGGFFFASDTNGANVRFLTNNGTLNEWVRITSAGNVGVGTQTPAAKLDLVAKASGATGISVQTTDLASANTAVSGLADGAGGTGVFGEAENGSLAIGVWGISSSGVAGQFSGNVNVTGNISKAGGSFKIDDPVDPSNKYLYHSFVESPDMKNIYDGIVNLDEKGEAVVQLPGWFGVLNRDFRYQLTSIGGFAPVYIAEEVVENHFKIAGGNPGMKVSWMVTGIRQDAWANAHRIPVEEAKPAQERGYYLHPELYGQPAQRSIDWAEHQKVLEKQNPKAK